MTHSNFEERIKNLRGTFAPENMHISDESVKKLKRIERGEISYSEAIEELKKKYTQRL